jgi:predicted DNA-binding transcriptional regulator YafY
MSIVSTIADAITNRKVIQFIYKGEKRVVEPFTLGIHKDTGNTVLRAYRVGGYSKSSRDPQWRLFDVSGITSLMVLEHKAQSYRPDYNPQDKDMSRIIKAA